MVFLEHNIAHLFAVAEGIHGGFGEEDLTATSVNAHFFIKGEVPEVFHVVPAFYDAILHLCIAKSAMPPVTLREALDRRKYRIGNL